MSGMEQVKQRDGAKRVRLLFLNYSIYFAGILIILFFSFSSQAFMTGRNITNMISDMLALLVVAGGATITIMAGLLDLSTSSVLMASAAFGAAMMNNYGVEPHLGLLLMVCAGLVFGAANGFLVVVLRINPWMATLSMQLAIRGFTMLLTDSSTYMLPEALKAYRNIRWLGVIPPLVVLAFLLLLGMQYLVKSTVFGRQLQAMGGNMQAAAKVGINVNRIKFTVYMISGACAGLAGVFMSLNLTSAAPFMGQNYEMYAIMAAIMGGASMLGGSGSVLPGALFGVLFISVLENGLSIIGIDVYVFALIRGCLIFFAIYMDSLKTQLRITG